MEFEPITLADGTMAISSLEIAKRTQKRHSDVVRDIRHLLQNVGGHSSFASSYRNTQNKEQPCFHLPKRECLILVSGYSVKLRAAIIDRWQELEEEDGSVIDARSGLTPDRSCCLPKGE